MFRLGGMALAGARDAGAGAVEFRRLESGVTPQRKAPAARTARASECAKAGGRRALIISDSGRFAKALRARKAARQHVQAAPQRQHGAKRDEVQQAEG
jgi:hypothetical protein